MCENKRKKSLQELKNISELAEKRISKTEDRLIEIMQSEEQREKRRINEWSLREIWDIIKCMTHN